MSKALNFTALKLVQKFGFKQESFLQNGAPVYYLTKRSSSPRGTLVFLPGYGDTVFSWTHVLLKYARAYDVVALDFPGYTGMSPAPLSGYPLRFCDQESAALRLLDEYVPGRARAVVGNSLGGWIAVRLAILRPEKMDRAVAVNPAGLSIPPEDLDQVKHMFAVETFDHYKEIAGNMWHRVPFWFLPLTRGSYFPFLRASDFAGFLAGVQPSEFLDEDLPRLRVPLSVIWGAGDRLFAGHNLGKRMAELAPGSEYIELAETGHMPQIESPGQFLRALDRILGA